VNNEKGIIEIIKMYFELGEKISKLKYLCVNRATVKHENDIAIEDYVDAVEEIVRKLPVKGEASDIINEIKMLLGKYNTGENITELDSKKILSLLSRLQDIIFEISFDQSSLNTYTQKQETEKAVNSVSDRKITHYIESYFCGGDIIE